MGKQWETVKDFIFLVSKISADGECSHEIKRHLLLGSYGQPRQHIKKQTFLCQQHYGFSSSHVWMWACHKAGWESKNWCFQTVMLEKTPESPLDCKEIKQVNPKRDQPWIFIGRTDAEAEAPILWLPDMQRQLTGKDPDARKDWRQ